MDCLCITGAAARTLRRLARWGYGLSLEPVEACAIKGLGHRWSRKDALCVAELRELLGAVGHQPLEVRVSAPSQRIRAAGVRSTVCSVELPAWSFERLTITDTQLVRVPQGIELLVDTPALSFISAAQRLSRLVTRGVFGSVEADARLLKLGVEECGTYALDPWDPIAGSFCRGLSQAMRASELMRYLGEVHGLDGLGRARRVAELLFERSDSPMETMVNAAASLPSMQGGLALPRPEANVVIPLEGMKSLMLNHVDHITPDMVWEELRIILEYLGNEPHAGDKAQNEDMGRVQDYQVLGYQVFPVTYEHVRTPERFNRLAVRLAAAMEQRGRIGASEWVALQLADEALLERQRILFKILLPAVQRR